MGISGTDSTVTAADTLSGAGEAGRRPELTRWSKELPASLCPVRTKPPSGGQASQHPLLGAAGCTSSTGSGAEAEMHSLS